MTRGVDIPDDWDGESEICICIKWYDSPKWIGVLQGLLTLPTCGRFWKRSDQSIIEAQEAARALWEYNMQYLPCDAAGPFIYDPETGTVWLDTDGDGIPDEKFWPDPSKVLPTQPLPDAGGAGYSCIIATGCVEYMRAQEELLIELLDGGADLLEMIAAITALIELLVPGAIVAAAIVGFVAALLELNSTIIDDTMDDDFYDDLKCLIFNHLDNNQEVTQAEFDDVLSAITDVFDGLQESIAWNMINYLGPAGMTNAATMWQVEEADCDDCVPCPDVETGQATTWWDGSAWISGSIPCDGRLVEAVGGDFYGARFFIQEDYRPCNYENVMFRIEEVWLDNEPDTPMAVVDADGSTVWEGTAMEMAGSDFIGRAMHKITLGVDDEAIVHMKFRVFVEYPGKEE
jgi:hypothetical protein